MVFVVFLMPLLIPRPLCATAFSPLFRIPPQAIALHFSGLGSDTASSLLHTLCRFVLKLLISSVPLISP